MLPFVVSANAGYHRCEWGGALTVTACSPGFLPDKNGSTTNIAFQVSTIKGIETSLPATECRINPRSKWSDLFEVLLEEAADGAGDVFL